MFGRGMVWGLLAWCCVVYGPPGPEQVTRAKLRELAGKPLSRFYSSLRTSLTLFRAVPKGGEEAFLRPFGATPEHVRLVRPFCDDGLKARGGQALANVAPVCRSIGGIADGCGSCDHCRRCEETRGHIRGVLERMRVRGGKEVEVRRDIRRAAHEENVATLGLGDYPLSELKARLDERDPTQQLYLDLVARGIYTEHFLLSLLLGKST